MNHMKGKKDSIMMLYLLAISVLILLPKAVSCVGSQNFTHSGCFSSTFSLRSKYNSVIKPVTWEICMQLCAHKVTIYAGVQARKNTCFCGNDIRKHSTVEDNSFCYPCTEDNTRWCGGNDTLSLYQILPEETEPLVLVVAAENGLKVIVQEGPGESNNVWQLTKMNTGLVDYDYKKQEIYFVSKNNILKSTYIPSSMTYIHAITVVETECDNVSDLTFNWMGNTLRWSCESELNVQECNLDGSDKQKRLYNADDITHYYFEPLLRFQIFFEDGGKLSKCGKVCTWDVLSKYHFGTVVELSVDVQQETIYVIGSFTKNDVNNFLVSCNYDFSTFKVLYSGPELAKPRGLSTVNGLIVWSNQENENYTIYRGHVSPKAGIDKLVAIFTDTQKINDLKIFSQEAHSAGTEYSCRQLNCSHSCRVVTSLLVECSCPSNMTLAGDGTTCTGSCRVVTSLLVECSCPSNMTLAGDGTTCTGR
ncbi:low-density lipoprotein receptor-related protein 4-like [Macrosteles quadrilineatus]|uniref:low-density lipoprotein receptor-related protein 4-like n=1 Tax=Macrosteles quadrilineatus TaxID=74068 RepID=UPI0023E19212|nr:low-density lipoprotein receptor-related protein 4-like [Macrosteles quadrilineatus]